LPGDSDGGILTGPGHVSLSSLSGSERDINLYGIPLPPHRTSPRGFYSTIRQII